MCVGQRNDIKYIEIYTHCCTGSIGSNANSNGTDSDFDDKDDSIDDKSHGRHQGIDSTDDTSGDTLPTDGPLTVRPLLQSLAHRLLKGKTGSVVAIRPDNGEIICLAANTKNGEDLTQAIATPHAPGSTFKTAQALTMLSESAITPERQWNATRE